MFIATLHGGVFEAASLEDAIRCVENYEESKPGIGFVRYEISVRYSNDDRVDVSFQDKQTAIAFLRTL